MHVGSQRVDRERRSQPAKTTRSDRPATRRGEVRVDGRDEFVVGCFCVFVFSCSVVDFRRCISQTSHATNMANHEASLTTTDNPTGGATTVSATWKKLVTTWRAESVLFTQVWNTLLPERSKVLALEVARDLLHTRYTKAAEALVAATTTPVSYTHLTLPTIYSV